MKPMVLLIASLTVFACSHYPSGYAADDGGSPNGDCAGDYLTVDGASPDAGNQSDGGTPADGGALPDSDTPPSCDDDDDCPDGKNCGGGACVCDGDEDDGDDGECHDGKALLCHYPPGNPANRHEICVGTPAVPAHQAHRDSIGHCP